MTVVSALKFTDQSFLGIYQSYLPRKSQIRSALKVTDREKSDLPDVCNHVFHWHHKGVNPFNTACTHGHEDIMLGPVFGVPKPLAVLIPNGSK